MPVRARFTLKIRYENSRKNKKLSLEEISLYKDNGYLAYRQAVIQRGEIQQVVRHF